MKAPPSSTLWETLSRPTPVSCRLSEELSSLKGNPYCKLSIVCFVHHDSSGQI